MKFVSQIDMQDGCTGVGLLCLLGGVAVVYWPAALILAGLLGLGSAYLIERAKGRK